MDSTAIDEIPTPLELINYHFSGGRFKRKDSILFNKINRTISWNALLESGYQRGLIPLLYFISSREDQYGNPIKQNDNIKEKLKKAYHSFLPRHMAQFHALGIILNRFEREAIDVIPLKGAYVAGKYYPNPSLRPMSDIDILVKEKAADRAKQCLINIGYAFYSKEYNEKYYEKKHFHIPYLRSYHRIPVLAELHVHIARNSIFNNIKIGDFWSNTAPLNDRYRHVKVPSKEMMILYTFWHTYLNLAKSADVGINWLIDLVYLLNDDPENTDWEFLERKTVEAGIHKGAYFCLELVHQLFDVRLKTKLFKRSAPKTLEKKIFNAIMRRKRTPEASEKIKIFMKMLLKYISLKNKASQLRYIKQVSLSGKI